MKKQTATGALCAVLVTLGLANTANAALLSRLGGQAVYDTESNLTWLTNANAAAGSVFDDGASGADGRMTWASANAWADSLTLGGVSDWRLPTLSPIDGNAFRIFPPVGYDGSRDVGYNISRAGTAYAGSLASEMAFLFYNSLGNVSNYDTSGTFDGACNSSSCLTNTGPFSNLQSAAYWTNLEFAADTSEAWSFRFQHGLQTSETKIGNVYAIAVRTGDIAAVPVPGSIWLMGSAMLGLAGFRRKRAASASPEPVI